VPPRLHARAILLCVMATDSFPAAVAWPRARAAALPVARAVVLSRLLVWAAGLLAVLVAGLSSRAADFDPAGTLAPYGEPLDTLIAPGARWDSVWYLSVAHSGYGADPATPAFFPLYPLLLRALGSGIVSGIALSLACFAVASLLLHRLTAIELGTAAAGPAVMALALFPGSLYFSMVYSEALFLALSVGAIYAARTGRWAWAGALGALAAATRSAGIVLLVPLALLWWAHSRRARDGLWLALVPAGVAAFCGALALAGHDALAPFHAQAHWYRSFAGPFAGVWDGTVAAADGARQLLSGSRAPAYFAPAGGDPFTVAAHNLSLFAFLVPAVPALVGIARRLPPAYAAYVVTALALPLSWPVAPQPLMSLPRFEAVLFPAFMWLGSWIARGGRARGWAIYGVFGASLAAFSAFVSTWHWVA
jgi:Mannosyltransferase (PIG-V)